MNRRRRFFLRSFSAISARIAERSDNSCARSENLSAATASESATRGTTSCSSVSLAWLAAGPTFSRAA
ncbi:hypothetical protein E1212_24515 [Jiangella ureilytica]|uniref:Uncharacterized protein n=1 Tax=Jiangella ureilytica TaxID=2530374 RepID=A0A4R4RDW4_9ACTN|nr:hypothetical protein E1212_24515 [Jiangella ureilytica]